MARLTGTWPPWNSGDVHVSESRGSHVRPHPAGDVGGANECIRALLPGAERGRLSMAGGWLDPVPRPPHPHRSGDRLWWWWAAIFLGQLTSSPISRSLANAASWIASRASSSELVNPASPYARRSSAMRLSRREMVAGLLELRIKPSHLRAPRFDHPRVMFFVRHPYQLLVVVAAHWPDFDW